MPAIQIARLKQQAAQLIESFEQPAAFVRRLHDLLSFYADHTHRLGQSGEPPPLLEAYHVPSPVLRVIERELKPIGLLKPEAALGLSDALWVEPYLEFRVLAAGLLGLAPARPPEPIYNRLRIWIEQGVEDRLLDALLIQGLARLRQEDHEYYLEVISAWMASPTIREQQFGIRALLALIEEEEFENIPVLFRLLTPFVRQSPSPLKSDIVAVLAQLARRSPQETVYFLRQNLGAPDNPDTAWFIRRIWHVFPEKTRDHLRMAIKQEG